ncbi:MULTISPECIES: hypothetical protein [unclassified Streptomyces]|uniref:hypothetical protein n=1 Tax=unclassified Streptomyces TaxID=2593676 RepID=UPI002253450C|nr:MULTISPECIES: hypothetical protein [unclassified Streptomyces]WSP60373.1 hypothetical protein OG306_07350 [Streptomyces sp. NBC_01241]WSU26762.1 hypothetical protein OG508_31990 [Streptomyces sp. NBC_01108]MCX4785730.1 hypothetical protein [Streptomyces sp. NBC_01221]MCX4798412.1 hypothetical protein [Streptomyces sp. NBC_01242]WSJ41353.1 hypothetical protein OG772_28985 [Streptomyces sp. NBC_01321]
MPLPPIQEYVAGAQLLPALSERAGTRAVSVSSPSTASAVLRAAVLCAVAPDCAKAGAGRRITGPAGRTSGYWPGRTDIRRTA